MFASIWLTVQKFDILIYQDDIRIARYYENMKVVIGSKMLCGIVYFN